MAWHAISSNPFVLITWILIFFFYLIPIIINNIHYNWTQPVSCNRQELSYISYLREVEGDGERQDIWGQVSVSSSVVPWWQQYSQWQLYLQYCWSSGNKGQKRFWEKASMPVLPSRLVLSVCKLCHTHDLNNLMNLFKGL